MEDNHVWSIFSALEDPNLGLVRYGVFPGLQTQSGISIEDVNNDTSLSDCATSIEDVNNNTSLSDVMVGISIEDVSKDTSLSDGGISIEDVSKDTSLSDVGISIVSTEDVTNDTSLSDVNFFPMKKDNTSSYATGTKLFNM